MARAAKNGRWIGLCTAALLAFWATRLHNLLVLPLFMDEATHLTRAQAVWEGKPLDLLLTGKALGPYLAALFYPYSGAAWIGRLVIVLIGSVGIAAAIALGRALHSRQAGLLAGALWLLSPYLFFFERMALVDGTLAALATLSAWLAVRMIRTGRALDAALCGIALALCVFAKTTGVIYLALPVGVAVLLPARCRWRRRLRQAVIAYIVAAAILIMPALYVKSQDANVFGIGALASGEAQTLGERLSKNSGTTWMAYADYFSLPFLALLIAAGLLGALRYPRRGLLLAMLIVIPLAVLIGTATQLYLRYLVIAVPGLVLLAALGLAGVGRIARVVRPLPWLAVGVWGIVFALPFITTAYRDPPSLDLPTADRNEYVAGWTSGYGLRDAAEGLLKMAHEQGRTLTATGLLGSCNTIRLYIPPDAPVHIQCPDVWDGSGKGMSEGISEISEQAAREGSALAIGEINGPVYANAIPKPNEQLQTYPRPGGAYPVILFNVLPSE